MNSRVPVSVDQLQAANARILKWLDRRLKQKGRMGYISHHEALGVVDEEYDELKEAVRSDNIDDVVAELTDLAVGCLFGIASLRANEAARLDYNPGPA